jgi:hypothetical protein
MGNRFLLARYRASEALLDQIFLYPKVEKGASNDPPSARLGSVGNT